MKTIRLLLTVIYCIYIILFMSLTKVKFIRKGRTYLAYWAGIVSRKDNYAVLANFNIADFDKNKIIWDFSK